MKTIALFIALAAAGAARAQSAGPVVDHQPVTQAVAGQPLTITATIRSSDGVFQPVLVFRRAGEVSWRRQELLGGQADSFAATLPGRAVDADLEYYVEAYDNDGNGPGRAGTPDSPFHITVASTRAAVSTPSAPAAAVTAPAKTQGGAGGWMPAAGWTGVGVGGAALGAGIALLVVAGNEQSAAQKDPTAGGAFSKSQTAASENTAGVVSLVAGGVVAIAGAVLALLPHHHEAADEAPAH